MNDAPSSRFDKRYFIVFAAALTQFSIIGGLFAYGLFFTALEDEFGWSRTWLSSATSLAFLVMGIGAIPAGRLGDKYGPRRVLFVSGLIYAVGYFLLATIESPLELFLIYGIFLGIGLSTHDVITLSAIARWFDKKRGMMTGIVKVGTAAGQVAVPPIAALLIVLVDWRMALNILGAGALILLMISAFMMKPAPTATGTSAQSLNAGLSFAEARRRPQFWILCGLQFLFFPSLVTVPLHIAVHATDLGFSTGEAALLLSVLAGSSVLGRIFVGGSVDRIGARNGYFLCFIPLIVSLIAFIFVTSPWFLFPAAIIYGIGHGGFFTIVSPAVAEQFGMKAHGAIFGVIVFCGTGLGAFGPMLAGWAFDVTGSYNLAFGTLAIFALLGISLVLLLRKPAAE